jgi:hypothetical protein
MEISKSCVEKRVFRRLLAPNGRMFHPKGGKVGNTQAVQMIFLLNIEGKIFLAILAKRMTTYMLDNKYIDNAVLKGGVPGVSECNKHTNVLTQIMREAKEVKCELAVIWLDLANAYGSIPYKLIQLMLQKYHVPEKIQHLLERYFDKLELRFTVQNFTTTWQRLKVGIVKGFTVSVILFSAAMNFIVKSVEKMSRGP